MYIILAILLLAILIVAHEFGHFIAARLMKIDVLEFSVGFGPRLLGWNSKKHETKFSVRAVPLGGFCSFYGEDDAAGTTKDDPRAFPNQNVWKRIFVILMGPVMNFVLAFAVAVVFLWCAGKTVPLDAYDPIITEVSASGAAQSAGMKAGDYITQINGKDMMDGTTTTLSETIAAWQEGDEPLQMTVRRGDEILEMQMTPVWSDEYQRVMIGVTIGAIQRSVTEPVGFLEGFRCAWDMCIEDGGVILNALKNLVTKGEGLDQTSGPVGIVAQVSELTKAYGIGIYIELMIIISINLGLMNLLPIPGLDGSRLIFGLIEGITRKKVPTRVEAVIHLTGMVLLFGLMIFFTFKDVFKLFQ